ncbi:MAG: transcriptional regulator [Candidatus Glassbacteria bacterium]|nr:transcriptional regulator [Candidatus Glassbacteria bacterium]
MNLDPLIHAPIRLAILSVLISVESAKFTFLKDATGATDGNLSTHLTKLEKSGYIKISKTFENKKPQTSCALTKKGREAFEKYLGQLETLVRMRHGGDA